VKKVYFFPTYFKKAERKREKLRQPPASREEGVTEADWICSSALLPSKEKNLIVAVFAKLPWEGKLGDSQIGSSFIGTERGRILP